MGAEKIKSCQVITVDFTSRKKTSSEIVSNKDIIKESSFDMSGFNEPKGNFRVFSDQELTENSEHILNCVQELSVDDVIHFVQMGSLDKKKLAKKLGLKES